MLDQIHGGHGVVVSIRDCGSLGTGSIPVGHPVILQSKIAVPTKLRRSEVEQITAK